MVERRAFLFSRGIYAFIVCGDHEKMFLLLCVSHSKYVFICHWWPQLCFRFNAYVVTPQNSFLFAKHIQRQWKEAILWTQNVFLLVLYVTHRLRFKGWEHQEHSGRSLKQCTVNLVYHENKEPGSARKSQKPPISTSEAHSWTCYVFFCFISPKTKKLYVLIRGFDEKINRLSCPSVQHEARAGWWLASKCSKQRDKSKLFSFQKARKST